MLSNVASQKIDSGVLSAQDFHNILQGHRNKKSVDFYLKLKKLLIEQSEMLNPRPKGGINSKYANNLVNLLFSLMSNKPTKHTVY